MKKSLIAPVMLATGLCFGAGQSKPNVLFIMMDDLRPELACYGAEYIHSPNLDQLASQGYLFTNHYVSVPTCGASRFSLVTGNYPISRVQVGNEAIREDSTIANPHSRKMFCKQHQKTLVNNPGFAQNSAQVGFHLPFVF